MSLTAISLDIRARRRRYGVPVVEIYEPEPDWDIDGMSASEILAELSSNRVMGRRHVMEGLRQRALKAAHASGIHPRPA